MKDKEVIFKQKFCVPLVDKNAGTYHPGRPAPVLGMRSGTSFLIKPLHDPCGEFAIVLYDPTIHDQPDPGEEKQNDQQESPKLDAPLVHKSLANILGIKKKVEKRPRVPVVIDPKLAKILRPHQVEGVQVCSHTPYCSI